MGERTTRKAGILKPKLSDPNLQRTLDSVIERIEVLDGIRGDDLDKAVTWRGLKDAGFVLQGKGGGGFGVTGTPGTSTGGGGSDGPDVAGPTTAPQNLVVNPLFLSLFLTWDNPPFNLQHIEIWRHTADVLADASLIGTTVAPMYVDYLGDVGTYYYWVRAVATDGTYSPYNDTAGTPGTTSLDPSAFEPNLNISSSNLSAELAARIDLIDIDGVVDSLLTRIGTAEGDILAAESNISTLQSNYSSLAGDVSTNQTNISANASIISTQGTNITNLLGRMGTAENDIDNAESAIIANANAILNLEASVGALDATGGELWEFLADLDGFTVFNGTLTWVNGVVVFVPTGANANFTTPTFSLSGSVFTQVVVRLRQTVAGGTWSGKCYYSSNLHTGFSEDYMKQIADPSPTVNEWVTLTFDMPSSTTGIEGERWEDAVIQQLRFELVSDGVGEWEIDWVMIAKYSTTALSQAIEALDVRVTQNENYISSEATSLTYLESYVNTNIGTATAAAISALTTTVEQNEDDIAINAQDITALEAEFEAGGSVVVNASAIASLQADVSVIDGQVTAQAQDITQLVASIVGGSASMVNTLQTVGENYGTTFAAAELQGFNTPLGVDARQGVAAVVAAADNQTRIIKRINDSRIRIEPGGVYEVHFSLYHARPNSTGSFLVGFQSFAADSGGTAQNVNPINNGVAGSATASPWWLQGRNASGANEWFDVTCYIIGGNVNVANCPDIIVNGSTTNDESFTSFVDGFKVSKDYPYVQLRVQNFNASPTYGDDTSTTLYLTDLQVRRIDTTGDIYAALQVEAQTRASDIGDVQASYVVKAELNTAGDPYITGFGLMADIIDGQPSSSFAIRADQFIVVGPDYGNAPSDPTHWAAPFVVDVVDGTAQVAINGELIVDGTIRASAIQANSITAQYLNITELAEITNGNMGTLTAGLIRTEPAPAWRVEIEAQVGTAYPIWYGQDAKGPTTGNFWVDNAGNVMVRGTMEAGLVKSSYFAPSTQGDGSFKIACQPDEFFPSQYTGKTAHFNPCLSTNYLDTTGIFGRNLTTDRAADGSTFGSPWESNVLTFYSPTNSGTVEYGRLGSNTETLVCTMDASFWGEAWALAKLSLMYRYDSEPWRYAVFAVGRCNFSASIHAVERFITRTGAWSTLQFKIRAERAPLSTGSMPSAASYIYLRNASFVVETGNFGYADMATAGSQTGSTVSTTTPVTSTPKMWL